MTLTNVERSYSQLNIDDALIRLRSFEHFYINNSQPDVRIIKIDSYDKRFGFYLEWNDFHLPFLHAYGNRLESNPFYSVVDSFRIAIYDCDCDNMTTRVSYFIIDIKISFFFGNIEAVPLSSIVYLAIDGNIIVRCGNETTAANS